ncbi:MAG: hypothetical protein IOC58_11525 [Methylobacterium sp.]|nr:hypothetical protein [Methylobacterium sp.]
MPLAKAGVDSGSRQENAIKERKKHFQAKHAPAKAGVDSGSRQENATRKRDNASDLDVCLIEKKTLGPLSA